MRAFVVAPPLVTIATTIVLTLAFTIAFTSVPSSAFADCAVRTSEAYIPEPPPGAGVAAAYFILTNDCHSPVAVIGAEVDKAVDSTRSADNAESTVSVSLHRSSTLDGVARMVSVERIPVNEGSSVIFAPGGLHIMLHGREFKAGEAFQFQLVLEDGDRVPVLADVVSGRLDALRDHTDQRDHTDHKQHHPGGVE